MSLVTCLQRANKGKRVFASAEIQELQALAAKNRETMPAEEAEAAAIQALLDEAIAEQGEVQALILEAAPALGAKATAPEEVAAAVPTKELAASTPESAIPSAAEKAAPADAAGEGAAPTVAPSATVAPMPGIPGLSMSLAQGAHRGTSFSPERRGEQEVASYRGALSEAWDRAARIAGTDEAAVARITEVFEDVAAGYNARYAATLGAKSRIMSTMIAGGGNFPVARMNKRNATADKRANEASEYLARGIKRLMRAARGPIDNSPESELERVRLNLTQREEAQEQMVAANAALRKDDDAALEDLGFTAEQIADLKKGSKWDRGFPAYRLSNNSAEIRRLRERLKSAEERLQDAAAGPVETERAGVKIVEDATDDRLRLIFDGKPSEEVREDLKANGFKWSPKNEAWQRQLTDNARRAAKQVLDKHYPQTREDDAGNVAMFSRNTNTRLGIPMKDATAVAQAIREALPTAPQILLHESLAQAPQKLQDAINDAGAANDVEAAYHDGAIHVFPQHMASVERMAFVVGHHEIRHHGLRSMLGPRLGPVLLGMHQGNANLRAAAQAKIDEGLTTSRVEAIEEALADMPLEELTKLNGWDKIVTAVRQWLRNLAAKLRRTMPNLADAIDPMSWTDRDVAAMVMRAENVSRGGSGAFRTGGTVFSNREGNDYGTGFWRSLGQLHQQLANARLPDAILGRVGRRVGTFAGVQATEQTTGLEPIRFKDSIGGWQDFVSIAAARSDGSGMSTFVVPEEFMERASDSQIGDTKWLIANSVLTVTLRGSRDAGYDLSVQTPLPGEPAFDLAAPGTFKPTGQMDQGGVIEYHRASIGAKATKDYLSEAVRRFALRYGFTPDVKFARDTGAKPGVNERAYSAADIEARFSRTTAGTAKLTAQRETVKAVRQTIGDIFGSAGAKVSWWDKTLGTQYAKAQKFPTFKRVFDQVQQYLEDVSSLANEAADNAPSILPKLETWKDLKRMGLSDADATAIAAPIFTGTLTDEKVYTDAELKSQHKLNDQQIKLYREFMATVNTSLDQVVAADVVRLLGDKNPALQELAITDRAALREGVDAFLTDQIEQATDDPENQQALTELRESIREKYAKVDNLKAKGYAPLMRFGKYAVNVADPATGESLFFGLYESRGAANRMTRELGEDPQFKGKDITQGVLSAEQYKLFQAVPMESLEMFANAIGAEQSAVFQEYLKLAKNNRSALKRLIKRKGTAGFSEDVPRVLAAFTTSNARLASGAMNWTKAKEAIQDIRDGDIKDEAIKLVEEVQNPGERAALFRGMMFANFIGGSVASALVNVTQPITMTLPYLSQFGGLTKAGARLMAAGKMAASGRIDDLALKVALKRAEADGIVSPQEIHHLTSQAMGTWGTNPYLQKAAFIWGAPFSLAEQFNRRVTFIAAYQTAKAEGIDDPFGFAEKAVTETQGLYNKGNAPNLTRSAIGASALTFKQFSIHYLEWMGRMWKSGPEGKKAVGIALALLILAAGTDGLPGADDLDDLIDTLAQSMGYDLNVKRARREFVANTLGMGDEGADVLARGLSALAGVPMDVSLRMSMGNLLPGTGILLRSNTDKSASLLEVAGPLGGLTKQYLEASQAALRGDVGSAIEKAAPVAIQNAIKGASMWATGEARDTKGAKVMEADGLDAAVKIVGFNPSSIARESQKLGMIRRSEQLAKNVEGEIAAAWARAIVDKDADGIAEARQQLADWNENNPEARIKITMQQLVQRAKKLRETRAQRFITSTSPERRRAVAEEIQ